MSNHKHGNGEGTIRKRERDGRWEARLTIEGRQKSIYGKTRQEVARKLVAAKRDFDLGLPAVRDERKTVEVFINDWLERHKPPTIAPRTWIRYRQLLAHVAGSVGNLPLAKITPAQIERLYSAKLSEGLSSSTVHRIHTLLHQVLEDAQRKGLVARNACTLIDSPKDIPYEAQTLTTEQVYTLLDAMHGDEFEALYILALTTGMREGELLGLHWPDLELEPKDPTKEPTVEVRHNLQRLSQNELQTFARTSLDISADGFLFKGPKSKNSRRRIKLIRVAVEALQAHRIRQIEQRLALGVAWGQSIDGDHEQGHGLVFTTPTGGPIDGRNFLRCQFHRLLAHAGLPRIRLHDVRHTLATLLGDENDVDLLHISRLLGHASTAVTEKVYVHPKSDNQRIAVAAIERIFDTRREEV